MGPLKRALEIHNGWFGFKDAIKNGVICIPKIPLIISPNVMSSKK